MKSGFFSKSVEPSCSYCRYGVLCRGTDTVVCEKKGLTRADEFCRRFRYDPIKRQPKKIRVIEKISGEEFKI